MGQLSLPRRSKNENKNVSDWSTLQKDDKTNVCLYYLFEVYKQGRLKKWVRKEFNNKRFVIYMAQKLSKLISITIIKEHYTTDNIFELSLGEMSIEGWL